ncbi:hypothetical protein HDV03_004823 [Kappamyces sp. JEL0829]|nr:hypothetical protein HDV03_004823 [Kappamyces sp. JEL0829]
MDQKKAISQELTNLLANLTQSIQLKTKLQLSQDQLIGKRTSVAIVSNVESILSLLSSLKQSLLLNDTQQLNAQILARKSALVKQKIENDAVLEHCRDDVAELMQELETELNRHFL